MRQSSVRLVTIGILSVGALAAETPLSMTVATSAQAVRVTGAPCDTPPPLRCSDGQCPGAVVTNGGSVVEPKTGRTYFLDYPCDLKAGRKGHLHSEPARRRLVRQLAAALLSAGRQRHDAPTGRRHTVLAAPCLDGRRRPVPAEHRDVGDCQDRSRKHHRVLARRTLAGRRDIGATGVFRLLQDQGRRVAEPVGRQNRRRRSAGGQRRPTCCAWRNPRSNADAIRDAQHHTA